MFHEKSIIEKKYGKPYNFYKKMFNYMNIGIAISDFEWNLIFINKAMQVYVDISNEELNKGNVLKVLISPREQVKLLTALNKNGEVLNLETKLRKNGIEHFVLLNVGLIRLNNDDLLLWSVYDITARKEAELEIIESEKKYHRAFNNFKLYGNIFAHDVNNIFGNISSASHLCSLGFKETDEYKDLKDLLDIIQEQVFNGSQLV